MTSTTIDNTQDVIDSRDVIARIEELEAARTALVEACESASGLVTENGRPSEEENDASAVLAVWDAENLEELNSLKALQAEATGSRDWAYGESLIRESYFTDYIEELIKDSYEMPKEFESGDWPYRHMTIDYDAAAEEAKQDYLEVDFEGITYLIRD